MRRIAIVIVFVSLVACSQPEPAEELADRPVVVSEDGPWTVRRATRKSRVKRGDDAGYLADSVAESEESLALDAGAEPPTGAAPSPVENQGSGSPLRAGKTDDNEKWFRAFRRLGIDPGHMPGASGTA